MVRFAVILLAMFGLYCVLGAMFPVLFAKSYIIPFTKMAVSYASTIMLVVFAFLLNKVAVD